MLMTALEAVADGSLSGRVLDAATGAAIPGGSVGLKEDPAFFQRSDLNGSFLFQNVPAGTYTIRVFKSGYAPIDVTGVEVVAGEVARIDVPMESAAATAPEGDSTRETTPPPSTAGEIFELAALEVTAERVRNTEVGLLELRQRAISIGDAVGSDFLSRAGIGDAAQAMTKIVGANVVDGKYAVIRGLGDRYSNTLMNGAALPSNDPSRKTVQLDIIPADLLEEVNTTKTFTPDKPGDFTGGSVNVKTKSFPEEAILNVSLSTSYNTQTTGERIATIPDADMDFFGEVDTGLPGSVPTLPSEYRSLDAQGLQEAITGMHSQPLYPGSKKAPMDFGFQLSLGNSKPVWDEGKFGYIFTFTRDQSYGFIGGMERNRYRGFEAETARTGYLVDESSEEVSWGTLANLALQWNPLNEVSYTFIRNQSGSAKVQQGRLGFDEETENNEPGVPVRGRNLPTGRSEALQYLSYDNQQYNLRRLDSHQFKGKHLFDGLNNAELNWMASFSETSQDTPIERAYNFIEFQYPDGGSDSLWIYAGNTRYPLRTYGYLEDSKDNYTVDFELPVRWERVTSLKFKLGAFLSEAERESLQRVFSYDWTLRGGADERIEFYDTFEDTVWVQDPVTGFTTRPVEIDELTTVGGNARSYTGTEEIFAYYLMADLEVTDWLRFIGGARIEDLEMAVAANEDFVNQALFVNGGGTGEIAKEDVLPALHSVIRLGEEGTMNLRFSYGKTLARPTFREFSPFRSFDPQTRETIQGNPNLERTLVDNYDMRWEWFITPGEVVAVSLYHKEFSDPIVPIVSANSSSYIFSWTNVAAGTISGLEIEMRKTFAERWVLGGNFSFIESEIDPVEGGFGSATVFEGQPEYILNFNVGYTNEERGLAVNLFYNYVDDTLRFVGQSVPNVFEKGRTSLDFNISKEFGRLSLKFSIKNILDDATEFYYAAPGNPVYERYKRGRDFGLSASYSF